MELESASAVENVSAPPEEADRAGIEQQTTIEQVQKDAIVAHESSGGPGEPTKPETSVQTANVPIEGQGVKNGSDHSHQTMEGSNVSSRSLGMSSNTGDVDSVKIVKDAGDGGDRLACDSPADPVALGTKPGDPGDCTEGREMKEGDSSVEEGMGSNDGEPESVGSNQVSGDKEQEIPDVPHRGGNGISVDQVSKGTTGDKLSSEMNKIDSNNGESLHDANPENVPLKRQEVHEGMPSTPEVSVAGTLSVGESSTEPDTTDVVVETPGAHSDDVNMDREVTAGMNVDLHNKGDWSQDDDAPLMDVEKAAQNDDEKPPIEAGATLDPQIESTDLSANATPMGEVDENGAAPEKREQIPDTEGESVSKSNTPESLEEADAKGENKKDGGAAPDEGKDLGKDLGDAKEEKEDDDDDDDDEKDETAEGKKRMSRSSPIRSFDETIFTVEKLFEYQWPQSGGEYFFVQEQISEYLAVTSFKRKYPALERRLIGVEERRFLKEKGVVTEEQVTLGLTALKADEVYDVMQKDFPAKYSAYARLIQQRQREAIKNKHKEYGTPAIDEAKMKNYIKKAVRQAAEYNALLMKQRREERGYYLDLQTKLVHCPKNKMKRLTKEQSKPGPYPVAVIPGQYQNYYKSYTPEELKYMPVNTAIYGPMATQKQSDISPDLPPGEEVSSDEEDLSVSSEKPLKPEPKSTSKGTGSKPPSKPTQNKPTPNKSTGKNNSKPTEKEPEQPIIEPPFDHETINPAFFKEQMQSVLPQPPRETPVMPLQQSPMVSNAPPPPVTQVLSQLLQQRAVMRQQPPVYMPKEIPDAICGLCLNSKDSNRKGEPEELVHCAQCDNSGHPSCLEMSPELVCAIKTYPWQCMECKTCTLCGDPTHEDKMMFCDECDRGYHTFCVGLSDLPTGLWACASCRCVPPARPLPPPSTEDPPAMTPLATAPVNGSPESTTATDIPDVPKTPVNRNGKKRSAEPQASDKELDGGKIKKEPTQAPTPPPSKKRNTKKKQATPAKG